MSKSINLIQHKLFQKQCDLLLEDPLVRFAGFLDNMGNLIAGRFKDGIIPLNDELERQKLYLEIVLREKTLKEFNYDLGSVDFTVSRRAKITMFTFQFDDNILFVSTENTLDLDKTAQKIRNICGI